MSQIPASVRPIPVLRPLLPSASKLLPYLERIDATRVYANWGPLVTELSDRLSVAFGLQAGGVVCANSGMSALMGGILATAGYASSERNLAIVPDFTFTASALSAKLCGYEPVLASSASRSWAFAANELMARPEFLANVGLVMPVAPFGRLEGLADWEHFHAATGIPVVIDAAASFEAFWGRNAQVGSLPVALSFHATKSFGTGEGGCIMTNDAKLAAKIMQCLNFGFAGSRVTGLCSVNGKMAEYAGAVGLAELDGWAVKQDSFQQVGAAYRAAFETQGVRQRLWTSPEISSSYVLLQCESLAESDLIAAGLSKLGVETRLWYGQGLSAHDAFGECLRLDLHGTEALEPGTLLGLPTAVDLSPSDIERVAMAVRHAQG